jgi:hypothetical protein
MGTGKGGREGGGSKGERERASERASEIERQREGDQSKHVQYIAYFTCISKQMYDT